MSKKKAPATSTSRKICSCQATLHPLINNCLSCGKIICEQENEGPCLFCGNLVFRRNKSGQSTNKFTYQNIGEEENITDPEFKQAEELKKRLLQYDASKIAETNIIDDQTDWFEMKEDVWNSKQTKEFAAKKIEQDNATKEEINAGTYISFDGQTFIEEKKTFDYEKAKQELRQYTLENQIKEKQELEAKQTNKKIMRIESFELQGDKKLCSDSRAILDEIRKDFSEKYKEHLQKKEKNKSEEHRRKIEEKITNLRFSFNQDENYDNFLNTMEEINAEQDQESFYDEQIYPESQDKGKCLSMLQPWASLLIEGFKRFEGRFWETGYRGPLWIQAGSTPPDPETVKTVEKQYQEFYQKINEKKPDFPARYPLGCLLGVVDLQMVLTKDKYYEIIPQEFRENSDSAHIFVVRNPKKLAYPIKFPGKKDIFDIPEEIRKVARKCLKRVRTDWWPYYVKNLNFSEICEEVEEKMEIEDEKSKNTQENYIKNEENKENNGDHWDLPIKKAFKGKNFQKKIEKHGCFIHDFFEEEHLSDINDFLGEKACSAQNSSGKSLFLMNFEVSFPFYDQICELFVNMKKNIKLKTLKCQYFYLNKKQKAFELDLKAKILLNIGNSVSLTLVNEEIYASQIVLPGSSFFFVNEKTRISFQNINEGGGKKKNKGEPLNLLLIFLEN